MKLLFLIGKKRSGKDTTADYIMNNYNATKHQLAGPIKDALADAMLTEWYRDTSRQFPRITRSMIEGIDYDREQDLNLSTKDVIRIMANAIEYVHHDLPLPGVVYDSKRKILDGDTMEVIRQVVINKPVEPWSIRRLMQTLGTDIVCDKLDRMYWVKRFTLVMADTFGDYDYFIVPDTRQDHELDVARAMGATVIHVVRPEQEGSKKDTHVTERGLPIREGDIVITNDGSLEELYSKINTILGIQK